MCVLDYSSLYIVTILNSTMSVKFVYVTLACADLLDQVETSDCAMHIHYTVSNAMD